MTSQQTANNVNCCALTAMVPSMIVKTKSVNCKARIPPMASMTGPNSNFPTAIANVDQPNKWANCCRGPNTMAAEPVAPTAAAAVPALGCVTNVKPRVDDSNNDKTLGKAPVMQMHKC